MSDHFQVKTNLNKRRTTISSSLPEQEYSLSSAKALEAPLGRPCRRRCHSRRLWMRFLPHSDQGYQRTKKTLPVRHRHEHSVADRTSCDEKRRRLQVHNWTGPHWDALRAEWLEETENIGRVLWWVYCWCKYLRWGSNVNQTEFKKSWSSVFQYFQKNKRNLMVFVSNLSHYAGSSHSTFTYTWHDCISIGNFVHINKILSERLRCFALVQMF